MKNIINKLRESYRAKKTITFIMLFFFATYVFSLPYFSSRKPLNYLVYGLFSLLAVVILTYRFLYYSYSKICFRSLLPLVFSSFSSISTIIFSHEFRTLLSVALISTSFFFIYLLFEQFKRIDLLIEICVGSLFAFTIAFIFHYRHEFMSLKELSFARIGADGYFDNVNSIATYISVCSIFSLYILLFSNKKHRFVHLISLAICVVVGFLTASKTFVVGLLVGVVSLFITRFRKKPIIMIIFLAAIVIMIILFVTLPIFTSIKKRIVEMYNMLTGNAYSTDYSTATRALWQEYATYLGAHRLLIGNGLNSFMVYSGTGTYSHANIAETFCNTGIIGLLIYYMPIFVSLYDCFKKKFNHKELVISLITFVIIREFFDVTYYSKINVILLVLICYPGSCEFLDTKIQNVSEDHTNIYALEI